MTVRKSRFAESLRPTCVDTTRRSAFQLELCVAAVTHRSGIRLLTSAEVGGAGRGGCMRLRSEIGSLVRAIAERLMLRCSAGTPVVRLTGFKVHRKRALLNNCSFHDTSSDFTNIADRCIDSANSNSAGGQMTAAPPAGGPPRRDDVGFAHRARPARVLPAKNPSRARPKSACSLKAAKLSRSILSCSSNELTAALRNRRFIAA